MDNMRLLYGLISDLEAVLRRKKTFSGHFTASHIKAA
jgi:hypothetical protein